jgi:hypothetical protein
MKTSDFRRWHFSDMNSRTDDVRSRGAGWGKADLTVTSADVRV